MENITMNPMTTPSCWQLALSADAQATFALATFTVQGAAVRPVADVKRDRAIAAATAHAGIAAVAPGTSAWSPPN